MAATKPLIKFEYQEQDRDVLVKCANGHDSFNLIIRVRLAGAMTSRHARCTACGDEEPIDS